ncbi:hypothetical protein Tco_0584421 [Tanacetum coccineum]
MNPIAAQQVALDNALVAPVVSDALALSPLYLAFLITAKVLEIYMQQFWHTITKTKDSSLYQFKLDKKKCKVDVEVFRDILQICPRLSNQEFVEPPSLDEEIASFIKELGDKGDIESITEKKPLVAVKEPAEKPAKKLAVRRHSVEKGYQKKQTRNNIHQAGGSSEGACLESEVPDELKGKSIDISEGTGLKSRVPDVSKEDSSKSEYES